MTRSLVVATLALVSCGKHPPLQFVPDALPDARMGESYRVTVAVKESRTPVGGMSVAEGALPPGLELLFTRDGTAVKNAAVIHGTPTAPGEYRFAIAAWCYGTNVSGQTGGHAYRIVVR